MIEIVDKNDGVRKLYRGYEDYLPIEKPQPTETAETETAEPGEPTETAETKPQPTETEK